jgi:hypothetical protein
MFKKKIQKADISAPIEQKKDPPVQVQEEMVPFTAKRFDASASVVGTKEDQRANNLTTLTMHKYQNFCQAVSVYRRQIQGLATAAEVFVRALEDFSDCVPAANIQDKRLVSELDFLVDSSQLLTNAHQNWAATVLREVEEPLTRSISVMQNEAEAIKRKNQASIEELIKSLHVEEERSYALKKKKQRDLTTLTESLNIQVQLADTINQLTKENEVIHDKLCQDRVEKILETLSNCVACEIETFENVNEGFAKVIQPNLDFSPTLILF